MPSETQQVERRRQPQNPAFLMQKPGHEFSFSPRKQDADFTTGLPPDSAFSWSSINNRSTSNFLEKTRPLKGPGYGFLGKLIGCFIPCNSKPEKEDDQKGRTTPSNNRSSISGMLTLKFWLFVSVELLQ